MITDLMAHAQCYYGVNRKLEHLLKAMAAYSAENYPEGRLELDGNDLFMIFASYQTHPRAEAAMEAHRSYIDVMYMVEGEETIYVKPTRHLQKITTDYDPKTDALLAQVDEDVLSIRLSAGQFIILLPQDAHAPACDGAKSGAVKKIIGKIRIA